MRRETEDIEQVTTGLVGPASLPPWRRLKLHGHEGGKDGKPTANCRRQLEVVGTEELLLGRIERPPVGEDECPIQFVVGEFFAVQLDGRNITYGDAVDLGALDCPLRPSNDLDTGGSITVLNGNGVEVVGHPVGALKTHHYREPPDDRELGRRDLLGQRLQCPNEAEDHRVGRDV